MMKMSSGSNPTADDLCGVCSLTRENHGDTNHEFNSEGMLIPKKKLEPPRNTPPAARQSGVGLDEMVALELRLVQRLIAKGLLDGDDLLFIFGSSNANSGG